MHFHYNKDKTPNGKGSASSPVGGCTEEVRGGARQVWPSLLDEADGDLHDAWRDIIVYSSIL